MEKLDKKDFRFIVVCIITIVVGGLVTAALFRRATRRRRSSFANRGQRVFAGSLRARPVRRGSTACRALVDESRVYLERELGLEKAAPSTAARQGLALQMRWFRSG
jgi:hypothetical protein